MTDLSKLPPQNIEAEKLVLGAFILERDTLPNYIDILSEKAFYDNSNAIIYKQIVKMFKNGEKIDIMTVTAGLIASGQLENVGGAYTVALLTQRIASADNIDSYIKIIMEHYVRRELINATSKATNTAYDLSYDIFSVLEHITATTDNLSSVIAKRDVVSMDEAMTETIYSIQEQMKSKTAGIPTGYPLLDYMLGGFHDTDLIILAARPGMGKTSFALSTVYNILKNTNKYVGFFSLEMSKDQLIKKLLSYETKIPSSKFRLNKIDKDDLNIVNAAAGKMGDQNLFICDTAGLSVLEIKAKARRLKDQGKLDILFIDYMQLIVGNKQSKNRNRENEVSQISANLKGLAKDLDIPVIALSQLNRGVESRNDKKPRLSDLRESGSIEQDADIVSFLYRPEYYEDEDCSEGYTELLIEKHRHGATGKVILTFDSSTTQFVSQQTEYFTPKAIEHNPEYYETESSTPF